MEEVDSSSQRENIRKKLEKTIEYVDKKNNVLFLTTSNRWDGHKEDTPKSTQIAYRIKQMCDNANIQIIEVPKLTIYDCEGNVSSMHGNNCGVKDATLKDKTKNPSACHRCWASINNHDDELWKISKPLLESDCCIFFGSIRWGQTNSIYQKLIERLTWLENRHTTLRESNILSDISSGFICTGQNWRGSDVVKVQKQVHKYYGFDTPDCLYWNWQYTQDSSDESQRSYKNAIDEFKKIVP